MARARRQRATPAVIESLERTAEAIELRKSGATFAMIGEHFGISAPSAHEMVMRGLRATLSEPAAELRALAIERLDHMLAAIWGAATSGDLHAQAGVLRLEERRAKLLGLDSATKTEISGPGGGPIETKAQVEDAARSFDAKALAALEKMRGAMRPAMNDK